MAVARIFFKFGYCGFSTVAGQRLYHRDSNSVAESTEQEAHPETEARSFPHKKEFVVCYSEAKKEDTRVRRVQKMKQMLSTGKVIS